MAKCECRPAAGNRLDVALHNRCALHRVYGMACWSVTGLKANESGRLADDVTRVTLVTWILRVVWIDAFIPLFQSVL